MEQSLQPFKLVLAHIPMLTLLVVFLVGLILPTVAHWDVPAPMRMSTGWQEDAT